LLDLQRFFSRISSFVHVTHNSDNSGHPQQRLRAMCPTVGSMTASERLNELNEKPCIAWVPLGASSGFPLGKSRTSMYETPSAPPPNHEDSSKNPRTRWGRGTAQFPSFLQGDVGGGRRYLFACFYRLCLFPAFLCSSNLLYL